MQVVSRVVDFKIAIAGEMIGEKAQAELKAEQFDRLDQQGLVNGGEQMPGPIQVSGEHGLEKVGIENRILIGVRVKLSLFFSPPNRAAPLLRLYPPAG